MSKISESIHYPSRIVEQIHQTWNGRLNFPPTKIPERYTGLQHAIALKVGCHLRGVKFGMCLLVTFEDGLHGIQEYSRTSGRAENKFSVLIDNVEVVDDKKGIVERVGGFVRLVVQSSFEHLDS